MRLCDFYLGRVIFIGVSTVGEEEPLNNVNIVKESLVLFERGSSPRSLDRRFGVRKVNRDTFLSTTAVDIYIYILQRRFSVLPERRSNQILGLIDGINDLQMRPVLSFRSCDRFGFRAIRIRENVYCRHVAESC